MSIAGKASCVGGVGATVDTLTCYNGDGSAGGVNFTQYEVHSAGANATGEFAVAFHVNDSCTDATVVGHSDPCPVGRCCVTSFRIAGMQLGGFLVHEAAAPSPSPKPHHGGGDDDFPTWAIVLIVIGAIAGAGALAAAIGLVYVKKKRSTYEYIPSSTDFA
jgi:hypothetical protein